MGLLLLSLVLLSLLFLSLLLLLLLLLLFGAASYVCIFASIVIAVALVLDGVDIFCSTVLSFPQPFLADGFVVCVLADAVARIPAAIARPPRRGSHTHHRYCLVVSGRSVFPCGTVCRSTGRHLGARKFT